MVKRRRLASGSARLEWKGVLSLPATPSDFIHHFAELVKQGLVQGVVLYCRVSARPQDLNGNSADQANNLRQIAASFGTQVVDVVTAVGPGWDLERHELIRASSIARTHGAVVLAETTDRFLRHPHFDTKGGKDEIPTVRQFQDLMRIADGVPFATHLDPDAPPKAARSYQRKRGQSAKGNCGGRPTKKTRGYKWRRWRNLLPEVRKLRKRGHSIREIARRIDVPYRTVGDRIRKDA